MLDVSSATLLSQVRVGEAMSVMSTSNHLGVKHMVLRRSSSPLAQRQSSVFRGSDIKRLLFR